MGKGFNVVSCLLLAVSLVHQSDGQGFTVPDTDIKYTPDFRDALCAADIVRFASYFVSLPSNCTMAAGPVTSADWVNYKAGFAAATGFNLGTNYSSCKEATPPTGAGNDAKQSWMCEFVNSVATGAASTVVPFCDKLYCMTDNVNSGLSSSCGTIGQRMCLAVVPAPQQVFTTLVTNLPTTGMPAGLPTYNASAVNVPSCDTAQCRARTSGAMGVSIVGAAVLGSVSFLLL